MKEVRGVGMSHDLEHLTVDKVADNAYTKLVARFAIIFFSLAGPLVGYSIWTEQREASRSLTLLQFQLKASIENAIEARRNINEDIKDIKMELRERTKERYTKGDAVRDFNFVTERLKIQHDILQDHGRRIQGLEKK